MTTTNIGPQLPFGPDIGPTEWADPLAGVGPYRGMARAATIRFASAIAEALPLTSIYDNDPKNPPDTMWARFGIFHTETELLDTRRTYRKRAEIRLALFDKLRSGDGAMQATLDTVTTALRDVDFDGVVYQTPFAIPFGRTRIIGGGSWWRIDYTVPFYSDDVERSGVPSVAGYPAAGASDIHNVISDRFDTLVATPRSLSVVYDNQGDSPNTTSEWVRFSVVAGETVRRHAGPHTTYATPGVAFAQIFQPLAVGDDIALELADFIVSRFRSVGDRGVHFGTPSLETIGTQGPWWVLNVQIPFVGGEEAAA